MLTERSVRAVGVVMREVLLQHYREVARSGDQEMVEAFAAQGADPAFRDGVGSRCSYRGADDGDVGAGEHGVEGGGELAVAIADQEPEPADAVVEVHEQVTGLLGDPGPGGVGSDPGEVHAPAVVLDHDEDVEAAEEGGVDVCEVDREDRVGLRGEELSPGGAGPVRSGVDAGGLEDLLHGGGGDLVAESDELALDSSAAPPGILSGHPQHQGLDRLRRTWAAWLSSRVGPARATSWACQRSRVLGETSRSRRSWVGNSLLSALRKARSIQVNVGRGLCRRSTPTS
jgi:hypothetical protein